MIKRDWEREQLFEHHLLVGSLIYWNGETFAGKWQIKWRLFCLLAFKGWLKRVMTHEQPNIFPMFVWLMREVRGLCFGKHLYLSGWLSLICLSRPQVKIYEDQVVNQKESVRTIIIVLQYLWTLIDGARIVSIRNNDRWNELILKIRQNLTMRNAPMIDNDMRKFPPVFSVIT